MRKKFFHRSQSFCQNTWFVPKRDPLLSPSISFFLSPPGGYVLFVCQQNYSTTTEWISTKPGPRQTWLGSRFIYFYFLNSFSKRNAWILIEVLPSLFVCWFLWTLVKRRDIFFSMVRYVFSLGERPSSKCVSSCCLGGRGRPLAPVCQWFGWGHNLVNLTSRLIGAAPCHQCCSQSIMTPGNYFHQSD